MLETALLQDFCERFYGYGTLDAPHWFICMEEGGGKTESEIASRLAVWDIRGRRELEDVDAYHRAIGQDRWFSARPPIQRTWAAMIRMVLTIAGERTDAESVRAYQRDRLARQGGTTRLSPLFPLPAQSLDHWHYSQWSAVSHLSDRKAYRAALESNRVAHLAAAVGQASPPTVVFFGTSYLPYWSRIAGTELRPMPGGTHLGANGSTRFIVCKHPATKGISNEYFISAGHALSS